MDIRTEVEDAKKEKHLLWEALIESWVGFASLIGFVVVKLGTEHDIVAGVLAALAAIIAMMGGSRTEVLLTRKGPGFWREHPWLKKVHEKANDGEMAGSAVGLVILIVLFIKGEHVVLQLNNGFTLLGVMSAATIASTKIRPILSGLEWIGGRFLALVGGSLLASATGEPAAAVFTLEYFGARIPYGKRAKVAVGLAAAIGSGGGLIPFAAPPILVVWDEIQRTFHWGLTDLALFLGVGCVLHVMASVSTFYRDIDKVVNQKVERFTKRSILPIAALGTLVVLHAVFPGRWWLWALDTLAFATNWNLQKPIETDSDEVKHDKVHAMWKPLSLALLLMAIDIDGEAIAPFIAWLGDSIPFGRYPLIVAYVVGTITAWVSHFADNALASRMFVALITTKLAVQFPDHANLLVMSVLAGALFGGFLTIPANLPNFYIASKLGVDNKPWIAASKKIYWTGAAYLAWIFVFYKIFC